MSRIQHQQQSDSLEIRIKPEDEGKFQTYFLGVWLVAWGFGWFAAFSGVINKPIGFDNLFMLVWIVFWTFAGAFAGLWLAWKTNGFEQIVVDSSKLKIKHNIWGFGPVRSFSVGLCHNLRAAGYFGSGRNESILHQIGMRGGVVAIDCSNDVIRFGVALEESEANDIVKLIQTFIKT